MSDGAERLHYLLDFPADSPAFEHDGLRKEERVLDRLIDLARGRV